MALIKCPQCGNDVSSEATQCPHCKVILSPQKDLCRCPECQNTIHLNQWTCPYCGFKRSKIDFVSRAIDGCALSGASFFIWLSLAVLGFVVFFNDLFG